jgi:hypothetical protein
MLSSLYFFKALILLEMFSLSLSLSSPGAEDIYRDSKTCEDEKRRLNAEMVDYMQRKMDEMKSLGRVKQNSSCLSRKMIIQPIIISA